MTARAVQQRPVLAYTVTMSEVTPVEIGWNRGWTALAALGSLVAIAGAAWFTKAVGFEGFGDIDLFERVVRTAMFAAFTLLFSGTAVTYALASFDASPVVVVNRDGVHDRRLTRAPIHWSQITSVEPREHGGQLMLLINVVDPQRLPLPANPLWLVNRLSGRMAGAELSVKATGLAAGLPDLIAAVRAQAR